MSCKRRRPRIEETKGRPRAGLFMRQGGRQGGAGTLEHFFEAVEAGATVLLAASVFHFSIIGIPELKTYLAGRGIRVRPG